MSVQHFILLAAFVALFIISYTSKGAKKLMGVFPLLLLGILCIVDYTVAINRGIGLVRSDFDSLSALFFTLRHFKLVSGGRFVVCVLWLFAAIILSIFGERLSLRLSFIKLKDELKKYSAMLPVLLGGIVLFIFTTYPNEVELFRADKYYNVQKDTEDTWYGPGTVVCHALGETKEEITLTNSFEALDYNYARGFRTFETDICFTTDKKAVLRHDWEGDMGQAEVFGWSEGNSFPVTEEEFLSVKLYDKYSPMNLLELYQYMAAHKDMYVVFDTKFDFDNSVVDQHRILAKTAIDNGLEEVLSRVVIQLYYFDMIDEVASVYDFQNYLMTMYVLGDVDLDDLTGFLTEHDIKVFTVPWHYQNLCKEMKELEIATYMHTIDDMDSAITCILNGYDGIYTDNITPVAFKNLYSVYGE